MNNKQIYQSFGELIYIIAMSSSNGVVQKEGLEIIKNRLANHPKGKIMKKAFNNQLKKTEDVEALYAKIIALLEKNGADRKYSFLIDVLEEIKEANPDEPKAISVEKIKEDLERINKEFTSSPPLLNLLLESRVIFEWSSMFLLHPFIPKRIKANSHPVLFLPPFMGNDSATSFMRKYLKQQGFKTYKWELGVNLIRAHYLESLEEKLDDIITKHEEKVNLVGWSGGGMLAKILANRHPDKVEQIITIGSPVWGLNNLKTSLNKLYEVLKGRSLEQKSEDFHDELEAIPPMPITCIYTKTDGVVPWKQCMEAETLRDNIQNIEVYGSHGGMGANPSVLMAVANALHKNLEGETVNKMPKNIEKMLYPEFWKPSKT